MNSKLKKVLSFGVVFAAVGLALTACSHKGATSSSTSKTTKNTVALITDSNGVDDRSFNQAAWQGFKDYGKEHGLSRGNNGYQYFESSGASDYVPNMSQAANANFKTIYGVGYMLTDAIKTSAKKYPKKNFVIIDDVAGGLKNVVSVTFKSNQASYLAGVAAAETTKTNVVGFVGGAQSTVIDMFEAGFTKGVEDTAKKEGKKITVLKQYIGNFTSADKAKSIAQSMYAKKADIVYHAAGNAGNGVFEEAKSINQTRPADKKVWVIGVDSDQEPEGAYTAKGGQKSNFTLTSALKGLRFAVKNIADRAYKNKFPGGQHIVYGLAHDGVSVTRGNMSAKAWSAVKKARAEILSGKINVPVKPGK